VCTDRTRPPALEQQRRFAVLHPKQFHPPRFRARRRLRVQSDESWFGTVVPAKTPRQVVTQLSTQIAKALREPDVQQRLVDLGVRPIGSNPEAFAEFLKKNRAKWEGVIHAANIRLD
jgi:hypothetical protein